MFGIREGHKGMLYTAGRQFGVQIGKSGRNAGYLSAILSRLFNLIKSKLGI